MQGARWDNGKCRAGTDTAVGALIGEARETSRCTGCVHTAPAQREPGLLPCRPGGPGLLDHPSHGNHSSRPPAPHHAHYLAPKPQTPA